MKIKAVIFNHNQKESAEQLFVQLQPHLDTALLDSGSHEDQVSTLSTHKFENLFWTGCWNKAGELFADYDVIWGIGGDCVLRSDPALIEQAIQSAMPFGIWSPLISGRVEDYMKVERTGLVQVNFIEGIAFAISADLWKAFGPFDSQNAIGWGQDLIVCHESRQRSSSNYIDGRVQLFHPPSDRYNHNSAKIRMIAALRKRFNQNWKEFADFLANCETSAGNTIAVIPSP